MIEVIDHSLTGDQTFGSDSLYAAEADNLEFLELPDKPAFCPADMTVNDYYRAKFHPYTLEDSNEVFSCRMFYYLMFESPSILHFKGNEATGLKELKKAITIPEDDLGRIFVEIEIGESTLETRLLGKGIEDEVIAGQCQFFNVCL